MRGSRMLSRLRQQARRLFQVRVTDARCAEFMQEAHRQSALVAAAPTEADDQAFVDAISWFNGVDESSRGTCADEELRLDADTAPIPPSFDGKRAGANEAAGSESHSADHAVMRHWGPQGKGGYPAGPIPAQGVPPVPQGLRTSRIRPRVQDTDGS